MDVQERHLGGENTVDEPAGEALAEVVAAHFDADSAVPTAACPAASRAVSTLNGEQLT